MQLKTDVSPSILEVIDKSIAEGERAVSEAIRSAGNEVKLAWRSQIIGAGLGTRLANTIRSQAYPKGENSLNAATLIWTKAPVIIGAHEEGALIRSRNGLWLAIPLPAAGKSLRGGRITPSEFESRTGLRLRFIYRRGGPSLLVAEGRLNTRGRVTASRSKIKRGVASVPVFVLVPQVKLKKRLNIASIVESVVNKLPSKIAINWR